jgi:hypothetical protein
MGFLSDLFRRKDEEPPASTICVGGHGLLLAPICPCRVAHLGNGALLVGHVRNVVGPAAIVRPGSEAAVGEPTFDTLDGAAVFRYGRKGPLISTGPGSAPLDSFFAHVGAGLGDAPWNLLCAGGFWVELPQGFTLLASAPQDDDPLPELHLIGEQSRLVPDSFVSFQLRPAAPETVQVRKPPGVEIVDEGWLPVELGPVVRWTEVAYTHEGEQWRRRYYVLPLASDASVVMNAGSRLRDFAMMRSGADRIARSFCPAD